MLKTANNINRRVFMSIAGATMAGAAINPLAWGKTNPKEMLKPNVLFVLTDQLRAEALSCYGNTSIQTPNLDKLAKQGVRCINTISNYPLCSPYRAQLLSGKFPFSIGIASNGKIINNYMESLGTVFKEQGYQTGYIGKYDVFPREWTMVPKEARMGFDYFASYNCTHNYMNGYYFDTVGNRVDFPGERHPGEAYEPIVQTDLAIEYMNKAKAYPFLLFLSFGPPHDPYDQHPSVYLEGVTEDIKLKKNVEERQFVDDLLRFDPKFAYNGTGKKQELSEKMLESRKDKRVKADSDENIKLDLRHYYALVKSLDEQVGRLMAYLEKTADPRRPGSTLRDNTILVFTSDHGDMLGSHRMLSKRLPFEESINVPLIISYPLLIPQGLVNESLICPPDFLPTLVELSNSPIPAFCEGTSFAAALQGLKQKEPEAVLIGCISASGNPLVANAIRPWRGVRTKRYTYAKLIEPENKAWLLFDNLNDPEQLQNLIFNPQYTTLLKELDSKTEELRIAQWQENSAKSGELVIELLSSEREERLLANMFPAGVPKPIFMGVEEGK